MILSTAVICGLLGRLIYSHFIIRVTADPRLSMSIETLSAASRKFPNSPRIHYRLASAENATSAAQENIISDAITHAERAVSLSQWDYRMRRLLGSLQEINGDQESAEKSLRVAARLAPNNTEVNWALANFLLRRGKLNDSIDPFRRATKENDEYLPLAFELLWQSSEGNVEILKALTGNDPSRQLSLIKFLIEQSLLTEALNIFRNMDRNEIIKSGKSALFISSLINAGQFEPARTLWLDLISSTTETAPKPDVLLWNGGFEFDSVSGFDQFDWTILPTEYARIGIDTRIAHNGSRALKITFVGKDTTTLQGEVRQLIVIRRGTRYQLECYAKGSELISPEGPRIAILGKNGVIATSEPVSGGSTDWQRLVVNFTAPEENSPIYVAIVRIPKFSYDDPTRGAVWFDDFTLTALGQ